MDSPLPSTTRPKMMLVVLLRDFFWEGSPNLPPQFAEGGDVNEQSTSQTDLGLVNIASEDFGMSRFNKILEVLSFIILIVAATYCVEKWCKNRREMRGLRMALSDVGVGSASL